MGEGRAVEGRKASPFVCPATPLLTGSPAALFCTSPALSSVSTCAVNLEGIHPETRCGRAFLPGLPRANSAKGSICINTLLPGTALQVECVVTHSKQTVATFLPGSRIARYGLRQDTASCPEFRRGYPELRRAAVPSRLGPVYPDAGRAEGGATQFHSSFRAASPARAFACTLDPDEATVDLG